MSETVVEGLARGAYSELEKIISKCGDEKVVEELMPVVVNILEVLGHTYTENEEHKAEIELLREDNEQLITHFEREKNLRKQSDRKIIEAEDAVEDARRSQQERYESMEAIVRMLELKSKNAADQVNRLEEKERETRKENDKMQERYSQLFKAHADHLERSRFLLNATGPIEFDEETRDRRTKFVNSDSEPNSAGVQSLDEEALMQESRFVLKSVEERTRSLGLQHSEDQPSSSSSLHRQHGGVGTAGQILRNMSTDASYPEMSMESEDQDADSSDRKHEDSESDTEAGEGGRTRSSAGAGSDGISREVEDLIQENNNLLATKNALNVVKDDLIAQVDELSSEKEMLKNEIQSLQEVKTKLKERIAYLEDNSKKMREYYEKKLADAGSDEDAVPYGQQKRFTRMEMARMVQEKNKYKEQLMELQEESRARLLSSQQRLPPAADRRGRTTLWKFFGNLFGTSTSRSREGSGVRYSNDGASSSSTSPPQSVPSRSPPPPFEPLDSSQIVDLQQESIVPSWNETAVYQTPIRNLIRPELTGRIQAYGWSVAVTPSGGDGGALGVPRPVYCRPLVEKDPDMKIWCAVGVSFVPPAHSGPDISIQAASPISESPFVDTTTPIQKQLQSYEKTPAFSCIWICSSTHSAGKVSIVDANRPNDVLEAFNVCSSHLLCIACVPGVHKSDYPTSREKEILKKALAQVSPGQEAAIKTGSGIADLGSIIFVSCATGSSPPLSAENFSADLTEKDASDQGEQDFVAAHDVEEQKILNARIAMTVWVGSQRGGLFVYSANREYKKRLHKIALPDAVLCIVHIRGRVFASLADGTVAVFHRAADGSWDSENYHQLSLGQPDHAIRSMVAVRNEVVWCGCKNKVHVIDPITLEIKATFEAHSRQDSAIRQMAWLGEGVWISIRLDNTLRLFHTHTHQHLQDLNVEALSSMMTGKSRMGISLVRITAMTISCMRLWIGTSTGVIISAPFSDGPDSANPLIPASNSAIEHIIPFCSLGLAQVSYHGHKEEVKFFVSVPGVPGYLGSPSSSKRRQSDVATASPIKGPTESSAFTLLMSGGEGYIDFRFDDGDGSTEGERHQQTPNRTDRSHLTVWQVPAAGFERS
ncbi:C-Jun-amino-terminal kinase-interacting protein 3 [Hypsibius exemplaris]|uniref:C-Jun-amino-terminal kinase-interacting protein 3 n=1 Tax=Hypsibius exemplaris TaxID=2072580 RepID=A0A1W0WTC1_HYPEX|nr:C-Jun-amino-terminal kinase-interacting protein 3 [Hypsibius exemplaris]